MPRAHSQAPPLSRRLKKWRNSAGDKSLGAFNEEFKEKSFAVSFVVLMALPALPLPTGGVTHIMELVTALLALEMLLGRQAVWLPKSWLKLNAGRIITGKLIGFIERFER